MVTAALTSATAAAAASAPWSWRVTGTLGARPTCSPGGRALAGPVCAYRVPNAPRTGGSESLVVRVTNTSPTRSCYAISLSTSYMAGLHSWCVRAGATGQYASSGPVGHYRATSLSVFVTSGSSTRPIAPIRPSHASPFVVVVRVVS